MHVPPSDFALALQLVKKGKGLQHIRRWDGSVHTIKWEVRPSEEELVTAYVFPLIGTSLITVFVPTSASKTDVEGVVLHELVHALDPRDRSDEQRAIELAETREAKKRAYFNAPSEVEAYRYQVAYEMEQLGHSPTLERISAWLSPKNKKRVREPM